MISIIAPCHNEEACLPALVEQIQQAMQAQPEPIEILLVDDGSTDKTADVIRDLETGHAVVRGLFHTRNFGQSASLATGFAAASGEVFVTLDADLQNPPREIPRLLDLLADDIDAVCGVRVKRQDSPVKRWSSTLANRYRDWVTGVPVRDAGCNFRVLRRSAVQELLLFNGTHRFVATILKLQGCTVLEVEVAHEARLAGESKYGIGNRFWRGIQDCGAMRWYRKRCLPADRL